MMEHDVWIPALHRDLTGGVETVTIAGVTVGAVVTKLEEHFPGIEGRLCEDGRLRPYIAVSVNGEISHRGLRERLAEHSDIHFIPALSGGRSSIPLILAQYIGVDFHTERGFSSSVHVKTITPDEPETDD